MYAGIYIRKDNEEKWLAVADKSEWINTLLENSDNTSQYGKVIDTPAGAAIEVLSEELPMKMGCCLLPKPCKHWHYNDLTLKWVNELTGESKEVA